MRRAALLIAVVVLVAMSAPAKRVEILRYTAVAFEDEPVSVVIRIEPNALNRGFIVAATDAGIPVRSSFIQLDGDAAMKTHWITWEHLPAGDLEIVVVLLDQQGPVARVSRPLKVLSRL